MRALRSGLAACSPHLRLAGAGLWVAWITIIYSCEPLVPGAGDVYDGTSLAFIMSTSALALSLVAESLFPEFVRRRLLNPLAATVLSGGCGLATFVVLCMGIVPLPLMCVAAAFTGFATSLIALRVGMLYSEIETRAMLIGMCEALVFGVLVYSFSTMCMLYHLNIVVIVLLVLLIPAAAFFLWLPAGDAEGAVEGDRDYAEEDMRLPRSFRRLLAYVAVLMFVLSVVRGYYPNFIDTGQFAVSRGTIVVGLVLSALVIAAAVAAMPRDASFGTLCYVLLSGSVVVVPLLSLSGLDSVAVGNASAVLFGITLMCIWGLICRTSFRTGFSPIRSVGMGFGAACLGTTAGFAAGAALVAVSGRGFEITPYLNGVSLAVCLFVALFLLRMDDIHDLMQPLAQEGADAAPDASPAEEEPAPSSATSLDELRTTFEGICGNLAAEYALSSREEDILVHLALGKDAKTIAEELFVSFNTVRTHIRRIYTKLDVHSRRELVKLVHESMDSAGERRE